MKSAQKSLDPTKTPFHWKHYEGEIILLNVRWYCSYGLSYRNLVEMMEERGYFRNNRWLLKQLCKIANECLLEYLRQITHKPDGQLGMIMTIHTFGEYMG